MEDLLSCIWEDYAEEHFQTKDPFYEEVNGKSRRRKAPPGSTPQEQKAWKKVRKTAWKHDRCFCGCMPVDCGLGMATVITILPVIGPCMMYAVHARLIEIANKELDKQIPESLMAKMYGNILFDFLITLPPILGVLFGYLHACSTRNAAMIHTYLKRATRKRNEEAFASGGMQQLPVDRFGEVPILNQPPEYSRTTNSKYIRGQAGAERGTY